MRSGAVYQIHRQPSGTKKGAKGPVLGTESVPKPQNCEHPCCYGKGRSFCWPCMQKLLKEQAGKAR